MQASHSTVDFSFDEDRETALTIYPGVATEGNRRLLEDAIDSLEGFEIGSAETPLVEADVDIAVFDMERLAASLDDALTKKREMEPELVPYLLLLPESSGETVALGTDADRSAEIAAAIDAILSMPTTKTEFAWQLHNLARQRRQSQQLARSERQARTKYQYLVDTAPDAVIVADAETGEIVETNPAAEELVGYTHNELQGRDILTLHPADEREQYEHLFRAHLSEAERDSATRSRFADGAVFT